MPAKREKTPSEILAESDYSPAEIEAMGKTFVKFGHQMTRECWMVILQLIAPKYASKPTCLRYARAWVATRIEFMQDDVAARAPDLEQSEASRQVAQEKPDDLSHLPDHEQLQQRAQRAAMRLLKRLDSAEQINTLNGAPLIRAARDVTSLLNELLGVDAEILDHLRPIKAFLARCRAVGADPETALGKALGQVNGGPQHLHLYVNGKPLAQQRNGGTVDAVTLELSSGDDDEMTAVEQVSEQGDGDLTDGSASPEDKPDSTGIDIMFYRNISQSPTLAADSHSPKEPPPTIITPVHHLPSSRRLS